MSNVVLWNEDKPRRCPACYAVTIDGEPRSRWKVYQCCRCLTRFACHPRLHRLLPYAGIRCPEHRVIDPESEEVLNAAWKIQQLLHSRGVGAWRCGAGIRLPIDEAGKLAALLGRIAGEP